MSQHILATNQASSCKGFVPAFLQALDKSDRRYTIGYAFNVGGYHPWPKVPPVYYKLAVKRLKEQRLIKEVKKGDQQFFKLTKKGKTQALLCKLKEMRRQKRKKWNGTWWLGLFDIPESTGRKERIQLRRVLMDAGFVYLQKSVYIFPGELPKDLVEYLRISGLSRFIRFLHVDRADDIGDLKKRCRV